MKKKIYLILFFFVFLVAGCSQTQQTHTVIFEDDIKIEYGKNTNTAQICHTCRFFFGQKFYDRRQQNQHQ